MVALTLTPGLAMQRTAAAAALRLTANVALVFAGQRLVGVQALARQDDMLGMSAVTTRRRTVRVLLADLQALSTPAVEGSACTMESDATSWVLAENPLLHPDTATATLRLERAA